MTAEETAASARETAIKAASLAEAGDRDKGAVLLAALSREELAAVIGELCDLVIARGPEPAPGTAEYQPAPDWASCWPDWVVSARRGLEDEFFGALFAGLFCDLVGAADPGTPLGLACLEALASAAAGVRREGAAS